MIVKIKNQNDVKKITEKHKEIHVLKGKIEIPSKISNKLFRIFGSSEVYFNSLNLIEAYDKSCVKAKFCKIFSFDSSIIFGENCTVFSYNKSKTYIKNGTCYGNNYSKIYATNSYVCSFENSNIISLKGSRIDSFDKSNVKLFDNSFCFSYNHSNIEAYDYSIIISYDFSTIVLNDYSIGHIFDSSKVLAKGCSICKVFSKESKIIGLWLSTIIKQNCNPEIDVRHNTVNIISKNIFDLKKEFILDICKNINKKLVLFKDADKNNFSDGLIFKKGAIIDCSKADRKDLFDKCYFYYTPSQIRDYDKKIIKCLVDIEDIYYFDENKILAKKVKVIDKEKNFSYLENNSKEKKVFRNKQLK